ncbi:MAG: prepilin peptidase [Haloarculaceae archaeon]
MPDLVSIPDLLRLLTLPVFGWIALRDVRTRRIPNRTWYPLAGLGVLLLAWEALDLFVGNAAAIYRRRFLLQVLLSLGFVVPLSYVFWRIGGFGGADAKAFFTVALLFPTYPTIALWELGVAGQFAQLPLVTSNIGVFSLTILSNTVLAGVVYPVVLAGRNALTGYVSPGMFVARPVSSASAVEHYGSLLEFPDRSFADDLSPSGLRGYFSWRGLDLDALRMYLQWRGAALADIRADPERFRDPASLPADSNPPGDGSMGGGDPDEPEDGGPDVATDGAADRGGGDAADGVGTPKGPESGVADGEDPWGAAAFLDDIEGSAYGTTPAVLRAGLESLVAGDVVWISPGIPFLVPLFAGLVLSFTVGDVLFWLMSAVGLV